MLEPRTMGITIMVLFALQGAFTVLCTGSLRFQRPEGGLVPWLYNVLNLTVLLVLTPIAALCLIKGWAKPLEWTTFVVGNAPARALAAGGIVLYAVGNVVLYWSRWIMGGSFRLGAVPPRERDRLIVAGPFRWVRHPMYLAVILMSLGLGIALRSWVFLVALVLLAAAIVSMIPTEEAQLRAHYGDEYDTYVRRTRKLVPFVY